jgi:peptide chain release factor 1
LVLRVEGHDLSSLAKEAGGHRVQRVPPTEKRGRVHTSTVTVAVMSHEPRTRAIIRDEDLEITWFSGTGPGGQNRNKVMASCRLRHVPTGIMITAQTRSRVNSLEQAKADLMRRLEESEALALETAARIERSRQVGSGQRGDKIRTIQFQNDTAVDHRTNKRITADQYMRGMMDRLW